MQVENKLTLMATKQEYSVISELTKAMEKYCESFTCCEACPFCANCGESDAPGLLNKILSEIQFSS